MITFFVAVLVLFIGFFIYGKVMDKLFRIDEARTTPAYALNDGVDYMPMSTWRVFLIQLLNIAGLGPIFGAILGACWGPKVYLWIVFGSIFAGAVHDYLSGMMSMRKNGASISEISGDYLGQSMRQLMRVFSVILLILVALNFSVGPASLISTLTPEGYNAKFWLAIILIYYLAATFLPIDKIIGKLYPLFGLALILMALGIAVSMITNDKHVMPELTMAELMAPHPKELPVWALMFVTVACGAISGFHATQSPMMARCLKNEKHGRAVFFGAMISEGVIALIWAAAGVTFYNSVGPLNEAISAYGVATVVHNISTGMLGTIGGMLAMIGVIVCPITSGDTSLRSVRLIIADWFKIEQKSISKRLIITIPLLAVVALGSQLPFEVMWRYFSWSNQTLATIVLWTGAAFLYKHGFSKSACFIVVAPATFMSAVIMTYILQAKEGFNLPVTIAYPAGIVFALLCLILFMTKIYNKGIEPAHSNV